ncbi:MAG: hypothetical protein ACW986_03800 [Promethearchaeota archaeon]|jgi:hypothetical protein
MSFFLEWYIFQVHTLAGEILVSWKYNIITGWSTPFVEDIGVNQLLRPHNLSVPLAVSLAFIGTMVLSLYGLIFKDIEHTDQLRPYIKFNYSNLGVLALNGFYGFIFPVIYLLPNTLYFPMFTIIQLDSGIVYSYSVGIGYILQLIAFSLSFPYVAFYMDTLMKFEKGADAIEKKMNDTLEHLQEPLDLDKLIAQETLHLEGE